MTLEPCPFCGSKNVGIFPYGFKKKSHYAECDDCGASTRPCTHEHDAINGWNKRCIALPVADDVPPLDNQPSNGFPSPYPTPYHYSQKQPKLGERVLLFDCDDNEWLCAQLIQVNNKTVWQIEDFRYWKVDPEPNHRWLPFPPTPNA